MLLTNHAVSNRADLRERTKTMGRHGDRRGQIADFRDSFESINWLYLLFKCGIKTKTHFEWLLWHWSSLGQLNFEPTRPNGLVGCKVPTDLVKISVKEATHMGFYYKPRETRNSSHPQRPSFGTQGCIYSASNNGNLNVLFNAPQKVYQNEHILRNLKYFNTWWHI